MDGEPALSRRMKKIINSGKVVVVAKILKQLDAIKQSEFQKYIIYFRKANIN